MQGTSHNPFYPLKPNSLIWEGSFSEKIQKNGHQIEKLISPRVIFLYKRSKKLQLDFFDGHKFLYKISGRSRLYGGASYYLFYQLNLKILDSYFTVK